MVASCAPHRGFLAAMADGETALVPADTLEHISTCADCQNEIRSHQALSARLREASEALFEQPAERRRLGWTPARMRGIAAGVVAAIVVGALGAAWVASARVDPVDAAVVAAGQRMQIESSDPAQVAQWCLQASGRNLPAIQLDGMQVQGARMDRAASADVVTVVYTASNGEVVSIGWLEGVSASGTGVEALNRSGHELLVVHSRVGTAVVMGSSSDAMWQVAAAIESA